MSRRERIANVLFAIALGLVAAEALFRSLT